MAGGPKLLFQKYKAVNKPSRRTSPHRGVLTAGRASRVLGDQACGNDAKLRSRLHNNGIDYVLSVAPECHIYAPGTVFVVPARKPDSRGPAPSALATEVQPRSIAALVAGLDPEAFGPVTFRDIDGGRLVSRFAFVRLIAANPVDRLREDPREEWLIVEWPEGHEQPSDYCISSVPADTEPEQLARLARLRWMIRTLERQNPNHQRPD